MKFAECNNCNMMHQLYLILTLLSCLDLAFLIILIERTNCDKKQQHYLFIANYSTLN